MNRNVESHFALNPTSVDISRSVMDMSHSLKTSFNVGDVIPILVQEVLPGDTFNMKSSKVVRMQSLVTPVMDNVYLDTYYFFVPNRLVWSHWKEFMGENTESAWLPTTEYEVPQLEAPSGGWNVGTIADYMGIRTGVDGISVNALPFRAYSLIMNEWFRDENLTDPLVTPLGDSTVTGVNTGNYITDTAKGGLPYKAAKYHDYFTSALPAPQKGPDVLLPVLSSNVDTLPVVGSGYPLAYYGKVNGAYEIGYAKHGGTNAAPDPYGVVQDGDNVGHAYFKTGTSAVKVGDSMSSQPSQGITFSGYSGIAPESALKGASADLAQSGLIALADGLGISVGTINQLRMAFQIQKLYERDAIGGSRYIELIKSHFGVTSPDYRLQRPEYLGGNRVPISVNQVVQTSETGSTPQGTTAAYSLTVDTNTDFTKSFTEHGYVIGVCVARYDHTYQQGINRMWFRKSRFDYYWPVLANIGNQAIKNQEIYAQGASVKNPDTGVAYDDEVFGYQEAWADYRYAPSYVTGEMRSDYATSLDVWHLADDYATMPFLSDDWIREDKSVVDRVLAVKSSVSNQLFMDCYFTCRATRPMPVYSVPGLIDHH